MRHGRRRRRSIGKVGLRVATVVAAGAATVAAGQLSEPHADGDVAGTVVRSATEAAVATVTSAVQQRRLMQRRRLLVATFMNAPNRNFAYLQVSAEAHGMHPRILGYGMDAWWPDGLGVKINALREFVHRDVADEDVLLFADAFDVVFFDDEAEVLARFDHLEQRFNRSIVFNAEQYCFPGDALGGDGVCDPATYPTAKHRWRYLNSGLMIGRGWAYKRMLKDRVPNVIVGSDQKWYQQYFRSHNGTIHLDTECYLLCAITGDDADNGVELRADGHLAIPDTGSVPAVVHFVSVAHWVAWRNGVATSPLHETFKRLYPAQADRLLDISKSRHFIGRCCVGWVGSWKEHEQAIITEREPGDKKTVLKVTAALDRWNIQADLGTTHTVHIYRGEPWWEAMKAVLCVQCRLLGSRHHECRFFPSFWDGQCAYAQVSVSAVAVSLVVFGALLFRLTRLRIVVTAWVSALRVSFKSGLRNGAVPPNGGDEEEVWLSAPPPGKKGCRRPSNKVPDKGGPGVAPVGVPCSPLGEGQPALPASRPRSSSSGLTDRTDRMELGLFAHKKRG